MTFDVRNFVTPDMSQSLDLRSSGVDSTRVPVRQNLTRSPPREERKEEVSTHRSSGTEHVGSEVRADTVVARKEGHRSKGEKNTPVLSNPPPGRVRSYWNRLELR